MYYFLVYHVQDVLKILFQWAHRDRYVELEMAKRLGKDEGGDAYATGSNMGQGEDELYEIPDSLKVLHIVSARMF